MSTGAQGGAAIEIRNAKITTPSDDLFVFGDGQFGIATGPDGAICAIAGRRCLGDVDIWFTAGPVSDLTFETFHGGPFDLAVASIYHEDRMLGSASITSNEMVDFRGFAGVTRLLLRDLGSLSGGFGYGRFSFLTGPAGAAPGAPPATPLPTPLPGALPLLAFTLGAFGVVAARRRAGRV